MPYTVVAESLIEIRNTAHGSMNWRKKMCVEHNLVLCKQKQFLNENQKDFNVLDYFILKNHLLSHKSRIIQKGCCNQFSLRKDLAGIVLFCVCVCVFGGGGMLTKVVCGVASFPNHQGRVVEFQSQFSNGIGEHQLVLKSLKSS